MVASTSRLWTPYVIAWLASVASTPPLMLRPPCGLKVSRSATLRCSTQWSRCGGTAWVPVHWSRCFVSRASPMYWSTARVRCSSIVVPGSSSRHSDFRANDRSTPARPAPGRLCRPATRRCGARSSTPGCRTGSGARSARLLGVTRHLHLAPRAGEAKLFAPRLRGLGLIDVRERPSC